MKASSSLLSRYRVDTVPALLRPPYWLYAYATALVLFAYCALVHWTSKISFHGDEVLADRPNHIYCLWHTFIPVYFSAFMGHSGHVWMQHPSWLMKHVHVLLRFLGVRRLVLGSTGHSGRAAAEELVELLKQGASTVMLPDGPHGPPFELRKGALHMSLESGVPILPMRFSVARFFELKGWDRKKIPLPFNRIDVTFGTPIQVGAGDLEERVFELAEALGLPEGPGP